MSFYFICHCTPSPNFFFFLVIADVGLWKLGCRGIYLESLL